jgi:hypothetical protein
MAASAASLLAQLSGSGSAATNVALVQFAVWVIVGVVVLMWIYRIYRNAGVLYPALPPSPGWAVGWYFVPVACLWKPYEKMRDAWNASASPAGPRGLPDPPILRVWWGLWILAAFIGNLSAQMAFRHDQPTELETVLDKVHDGLSIVLDLVFILMIRRLCAIQLASRGANTFD